MYLWNSEENDFPFSFSSTCKAYAKNFCVERDNKMVKRFSRSLTILSCWAHSQKQYKQDFPKIIKFYTIQSSSYTTMEFAKLPPFHDKFSKKLLCTSNVAWMSCELENRAKTASQSSTITRTSTTDDWNETNEKKITQLFTYERRRLTMWTFPESRSMYVVYEKLKLKIEWVNV